MKFGKRMQEEMLEHWAAYYVSYKRLKQLCIRSPLKGDRFTSELFRVIREELKKAEDHFRTLLEELTVQHDTLVSSERVLDRESPLAPRGTPHNLAGSFFPQRKSKRRSKSGDENSRGTDMGNASVTELNASFPEGNNSGYSSIENDHATVPNLWEQDEGLVAKIVGPVKGLFMRIIGDSQSPRSAVGSGDMRVLRSQFIEWYASAHRLEHFAELNLEALRKTLKKLVKHRGEEGDFTNAVEAEIAMSPLSTLLPKLHQMAAMISQDFQRRFDEPLDQYKDLVMNTKEQWHAKWRFVLLSSVVFGAAMSSPIFVEHPAAHKCFALFSLVVTMWITEAIPFFCTAMLIPIVAVPLGILRDPSSGDVATPVVSSRIMLSHVFDHVQILVLGGLTIAKALSRVRIEEVAASWLHHHTAHRPSLYLLGVMVLSCLLCSFVSNVAAPLLVLGVIQKTLWEFPSDTNAPKAILLGLAISCNLGGMLSPIASPQNAVALQVLTFHNVSFSAWVAISLPLVAVTLLGAWWLLLWWFKPFEHVSYIPLQVTSAHNASTHTPRTVETVFVVTVSLITVVLWCLPASLFFGDTGIIALIPIVLFFGVGVLKKEDFNTLSWHLMFLLAGGNMLGVCARDSHMVDLVASLMEAFVASQSAYVTVAVVVCSVGLVTTFVSHTVAAMILLPIVAKIGFMLPAAAGASSSAIAAAAVHAGKHATSTAAPAVFSHLAGFSVHSLFSASAISPATLVFLSVLMCSGAMAFPISSFPNVNSLLAEDEFGKPYLAARDFLGIGTVITLFLVASLATWMLPLTALLI
jgi:phosphate transporter